MPSLRTLEAKFLHRNADGSSNLDEQLAGADGIMFLCPKCFAADGRNSHSVICWFDGRVPDDLSPGPGRWVPDPKSTGLDDLTFIATDKRPLKSVYLNAKSAEGRPLGCQWHGFVKDGSAD